MMWAIKYMVSLMLTDKWRCQQGELPGHLKEGARAPQSPAVRGLRLILNLWGV